MPLFAGLLVLCLLLLDLLKLQSTPESPLLSGDAEAIRAAKILRTNFTSAYGDSVILVVSGLTGSKVLLRKTLDRVLKEIEADPGVEQTISYRNTQDTLFLGRNGRGFVVVVGLADSVEPDARDSLLARLRMRTDRVLSELRDTSPLLAMRWTGESLLDSDLWNISAQEARQAELRILPLVLVVLVVTFGSFVAATIPVGIGLASVLFALGATATIGHWFPLSSVLTSVVTMMGLGLGVDYALLMVSRFRYVHLVNSLLRRRRPLRQVVGILIVLLVGLVIQPQFTIALAASAYAISGPILRVLERFRGHSAATPGSPTSSSGTSKAKDTPHLAIDEVPPMDDEPLRPAI